ncbi:MAG: hypothetical protein VKM17_00980, partial [Cyanobacteriota bacterium]|nr:hypothetical protein [Cyanobacteriota bacterium]
QYRIARNIGGTVVACGASPSNCNIFTATTGGNTLSVTNPAPIYSPSPNSFSYISLFSGALTNATGGTFGIVNSYTSNTEILNEFIISRSVASLGFDTTQRYEFIIGGETLIIGTNQVPAPLPLLGAGAAFGFSRKLRSRIRNHKSSTEPTAS